MTEQQGQELQGKVLMVQELLAEVAVLVEVAQVQQEQVPQAVRQPRVTEETVLLHL
jgi:hypothetical protein